MKPSCMKPSNHFFSFGSLVSLFILLAGLVYLIIWFFLDHNYRAVYQMKLKNYEKSQHLLLSILGKDTFSPVYRMNLAFNYLLSNQYEKSIQEYQTVRRFIQSGHIQTVKNYPLNFYIAFNSATSATGKNQVDRALVFYQQALAEESAQPLKVKTNIELLTKSSAKNREKKNKAQQKNKPQKKNQSQNQTSGQSQNQTKNQLQNQSKSQKSVGKKSSKWSDDQISSILKSIQDQELRIKQRRNQGRRRTPHNGRQTKDW